MESILMFSLLKVAGISIFSNQMWIYWVVLETNALLLQFLPWQMLPSFLTHVTGGPLEKAVWGSSILIRGRSSRFCSLGFSFFFHGIRGRILFASSQGNYHPAGSNCFQLKALLQSLVFNTIVAICFSWRSTSQKPRPHLNAINS